MKKAYFFLVLLFASVYATAQNFEDLSYGTDRSLEVITWNIQFFPHNGQATIDYLSELIVALDADIIAFQEIHEVGVFNQMIDQLDGFESYVGTTDDLIKLAYVYKTETVQANSIYEIYTGYDYWLPFIRRPLVMEFIYNGEEYVIINNHFKALGDGILDMEDPYDEENRRWVATNLLKDYIDTNFSDDKVIVLGDLNDEQTDEYGDNVFQSIINDQANYMFATAEIAHGDSDEWSYPDYPSHIDHILITNELFNLFAAYSSSVETLAIEDYMEGEWGEYRQNVSDHRPVAMKLFDNGVTVFYKNFNDRSITSGGWTDFNVTGDQNWFVSNIPYGLHNTFCGQMSGFDDGANENENWLISPEFVPDDYTNLRFSFWNTSAYTGSPLKVFFSSDYTDNPQTATWQELENVNWHDGENNWEWTFSGMLDLSGLTGSTGRIAFQYLSSDTDGATWELDEIILTDAVNLHEVTTSANIDEGGSTYGDGFFTYGNKVMLRAINNSGYDFVNWTENGFEVSDNPEFIFTIDGDKHFVGNFQSTSTSVLNTRETTIQVYPNPTKGNLFIEGEQLQQVEIFDVFGKMIFSLQINADRMEVPLDEISSGAYFVKVKAGDQVFTSKILRR